MSENRSVSQSPASRSVDGQVREYDSLTGCFVQLAWSMGGFALVLILWATILRETRWTLTLKDLLYWAAVLAMIAARHLDAVRYGGKTTAGTPASARTVRRYAAMTLGITVPLWCVAHSIEL